MKRFMLVIGALLLCQMVWAQGQVVFQEDFIRGEGDTPTDWRFDANRGECSGAWDDAEPPGGGRSIRLENQEDSTARATWTYLPRIEIKPSTMYRLSFKVMRIDVEDTGRAYLIVYEDGVQAPSHWHVSSYMNGSQDWQDQVIELVTREDSSWLRLQCKLWDGTGFAWFDDIVLEEIGPAGDLSRYGRHWPPADDGSDLQLAWYPAQRRPDTTMYLLRDHVNPYGAFFWGRREEVHDPHLLIQAPVGLNIVGPVVHGRASMADMVENTPREIEGEDGVLHQWRVPLRAEPLLAGLNPEGPNWTQYHFVYLEPTQQCPEQFTLTWQLESAGEAGPVHTIEVITVPVRGEPVARVESFPIYAQHTEALRYPTAEGRQRILDYLFYPGIEGGLALGFHQTDDVFIDDEINAKGFMTWAWHWDGYNGARTDEQALVFDNGDVSPRHVCPQVQVERQEPWWSTLQGVYARRLVHGFKTLILNFEPPVFNCCFCHRCREAFAAHSGMDETQVSAMTPQELQQLPEHAWGRFRAMQNAVIAKNHAAAIHEIDPEVAFSICGPPANSWTMLRGMDITLFEPEIAFHTPMIYSIGTTYEADIRASCENAQNPVIPFVLASDIAVPQVFPMPEDLRINLLATAFSGGKGAVLWVGIESLDGQYVDYLRRTVQEIGAVEPYLLDARRRAEPGVRPDLGPVRPVKVGDRELRVPERNSAPLIRFWHWENEQGRFFGVINYDRENSHTLTLGEVGTPLPKTLLGPTPVLDDYDMLRVELLPYEAGAYAW